MRERFGLRVNPEDRKAALGNADEELANWCLMLPTHLQMRTSEVRKSPLFFVSFRTCNPVNEILLIL